MCKLYNPSLLEYYKVLPNPGSFADIDIYGGPHFYLMLTSLSENALNLTALDPYHVSKRGNLGLAEFNDLDHNKDRAATAIKNLTQNSKEISSVFLYPAEPGSEYSKLLKETVKNNFGADPQAQEKLKSFIQNNYPPEFLQFLRSDTSNFSVDEQMTYSLLLVDLSKDLYYYIESLGENYIRSNGEAASDMNIEKTFGINDYNYKRIIHARENLRMLNQVREQIGSYITKSIENFIDNSEDFSAIDLSFLFTLANSSVQFGIEITPKVVNRIQSIITTISNNPSKIEKIKNSEEINTFHMISSYELDILPQTANTEVNESWVNFRVESFKLLQQLGLKSWTTSLINIKVVDQFTENPNENELYKVEYSTPAFQLILVQKLLAGISSRVTLDENQREIVDTMRAKVDAIIQNLKDVHSAKEAGYAKL